MRRLLICIQVALVVLLGTSIALGGGWQDRRKAQALGREAKALVRKGKFEKAAKKFEKADDLTPAPSYKLGLANMLVELEDFVQAGDVLSECVEVQPRQWTEKKAWKKCVELASELEERTPTLEVDVFEPSADEVSITLDGEELELTDGTLAYNPGKYELVAEAEGYETFTKNVKLEEGDHKSIEITLKKVGGDGDDDEDDDDGGGMSAVPAYVSWGIGAVGLGLGVAFGIAAIQTTNQVLTDYGCEDGTCPPEAEDDLNVAKTNGNISTAGFVVGAVGIAAGTVLYLLSGDDDDDDDDDHEDVEDEDEEGRLRISAKPLIGLGYVGVTGTF